MPKHSPEITRNAAEYTLDQAMEAIKVGAAKHGNTHDSLRMMAELWTTYITHISDRRSDNVLQAHDVATMMVLLKVARTAYGDVSDNYVDAAGYSALAAMLNPGDE